MHAALLTTCLFALTAVCATQAVLAFGAVRANLGRLLIALLILAVYAHTFGSGFAGGEFTQFAIAGGIGFGCGGFCMMHALKRIGSTFGLLVVECAATISTTIMAWQFLGAAILPVHILGAGICLLGVVIAFAPFHMPSVPKHVLHSGIAFAIAAAICQGASWTLSKGAFNSIADSGASLGPMTASYQRLIGGFVIAVVIFLIQYAKRWRQFREAFKGPGKPWKLGWVIANALAGPVLGVSCMLWAIRSVGNPGLVQAVVATATLVSVPLARRLEVRTFGIQYFAGAGIAISGVAVLVLLPL